MIKNKLTSGQSYGITTNHERSQILIQLDDENDQTRVRLTDAEAATLIRRLKKNRKIINGKPKSSVKSSQCKKHGGDLEIGDGWLCDTCSRSGINFCKCGSPARIFGASLMTSITCESCKEFVMGVDIDDIRKEWNHGKRGVL